MTSSAPTRRSACSTGLTRCRSRRPGSIRQIAALEHKHTVIAAAGLRPYERQMREYSFKPFAVVADLDHQQSGGGQMLCRLAQDYAYCVKPVAASCECEPRLMEMFTRQLMHDAGADIGRIGDDQVITLAVQCRKQIRPMSAPASCIS